MKQADAARPDGSELSAELGQVPERAKPRAWAIFLDDGNARMWGTLQPHVQKLADAEGLTITPLYDQATVDRLRARVLELEAVHEDASGAVLAERKRIAQRLAAEASLEGFGCACTPQRVCGTCTARDTISKALAPLMRELEA